MIGQVVLATDEHRRLDELIRNSASERIPIDDLLGRGLLVGRRREADENLGHEFADRRRERLSVVAVVLVREHDQVFLLLKVIVESLAQALLELARPTAGLRIGLKQSLDREHEQLDLGLVLHRCAHHGCREVLRGDDDRLCLHTGQQAPRMARSEVVYGLPKDGLSGCDYGEVAHAFNSEVVDRRGHHVGLADGCGQVDHAFKWRFTAIDLVVLGDRLGDRVESVHVGYAQIKPGANGRDGLSVDERSRDTHCCDGSAVAATCDPT